MLERNVFSGSIGKITPRTGQRSVTCAIPVEARATPRDIRSTIYNRILVTTIEVVVEATTSYDTTVDNICKEVEDILSANRSISGTASSTIYLNTKFLPDASGEKPIMVATLTYEITYLT